MIRTTTQKAPPTPPLLQHQNSGVLKLNPAAVRERAKSIPGCREVFASGDAVISFIVGLDVNLPSNTSGSPHPDSLARVNIFVDTGTVGTCRVLGGKVRQTFCRNVSSLDVVERLLKFPETPLVIDESLIGLDDVERSRKHAATPPSVAKAFSSSNPQNLQKELELADVGLCILQGEREKLNKHLLFLQDIVNTKKKKANSSQDEANDEDSVADGEDTDTSSVNGMEFQFNLPADVMAQVDQCLKDITRMEKLVRGVATNGRGTVFLYGNGGVAYTPSIPKALYQKLRQLRNSSFSARPCYISLGTRERYYVAFNDGTADWKGPKALDKILKKCINSQQQPLSVSFGSTYDTFFVVFKDGSWQYQGRGIPASLEEKLAARDDRADLVTVNLGPNGEWFLKARNGRMWWCGISTDLDSVLTEILNAGHFLHFLDFGENGSYFVSYDE